MWKIAACATLLSCVLVNSQGTDSSTTETATKEFLTTEEYLDNESPIVCEKTLTTNSSSFSLEHLLSKVADHQCLWSITPVFNKTTGISLFFDILFLHEKDHVTVFKNINDTKNDSLSIISPLHASNGSVTLVTSLPQLFIKLKGSNNTYIRKFKVMYEAVDDEKLKGTCHFDLSGSYIQLLYSPVHAENKTFSCQYVYNQHSIGSIPSFIFEQYNFSGANTFSVDKSSLPEPYNNATPVDFFSDGTMKITVTMTFPTSESYRLRIHPVNKDCSWFKLITGSSEPFTSPAEIFNNGSIIGECRWILQSKENKMLSVEFKDLHFDHPLDIISINDGASELSSPLLQVTTSNRNASTNKLVRTTAKYIWIAFKTTTFASKVSGQVIVHEQGGHFKGNGTIKASPDKDDPTYLLEVEPDQVILLNFIESNIKSPAKLTIYDGFDTSNVLATLHGNIWYPIVSRTSKMLVIGSNFDSSNFTAKFEGVSPDCSHMSTYTSEDYILSGHCNASCIWVIPPQDLPGKVLLLNLQFVSLGKDDQIDISKLDSAGRRVGVVFPNETHVPQLIIPADVGALVQINRGICEKAKSDIVLVGHSSYVPACGKNLTLTTQAAFQITSPLYPDTYPVFANCHWQLSVPKNNLIHLAFNTLKLAPNHCIKVHSGNKTEQFAGSELPDDLFLTGESFVEFNSLDCNKTPKITDTLLSSAGFVVNGTVVDCGEVLSKKTSGEFTVPANKSLCIWKVNVPETGSNANDVNIIKYTMSKKDSKENFELFVYDGTSVREKIIGNNSLDIDIWSRTNNLIFIYRRIDSAKASSVLVIKYSTISCNQTMQCDNKVCLHPDWRCNGVDDCGDFSDERNCASVPIPPKTELLGYSSLAFWLTVFIMFATGIFCGVVGPFCYQKYKNGQYRRFGDISIIE